MHTRTLSACFAIVGMLVAVGCGEATSSEDGGGSNGSTLKDRTLQGTLEGTDWKATAGKATVSDGNIEITLFDGPDDACTDQTGSGGWFVSVRTEEAKEKLQLSPSKRIPGVTFQKTGQSIVPGNGFVEITSITEQKVEGNVVAKLGENTVNGRFDATRCRNQSSSDN